MTTEISEEALFKARLSLILRWGLAVIAATAAVVTLWTKQVIAVSALEATTAVHDTKIHQIEDNVTGVKAQLDAQMSILRYLGNDRRGPKPEVLKEPNQ